MVGKVYLISAGRAMENIQPSSRSHQARSLLFEWFLTEAIFLDY